MCKLYYSNRYYSIINLEDFLSLSSPYNHILPVLLFHQMRHPLPHQPLCCTFFSVKMSPTDRDNAVVSFQHIVAGAAHDGFCQFRSYETVHAHADLVYFFFIQVHSPFQILRKKYQPSNLTVGKIQFSLFNMSYAFYYFYLFFIINKSPFFKFC